MEEQAFRASLADPALSHALDRRVLHEFFHHAAPAVASKGLSVALPLSVAGLISTTLIDELLAQLEQSTLPGRLLHLIVPAEALLLNPQESTKAIQTLRQAGCHIIVSQIGRDLQIFNLLLDSELSASIHGNMMDEMLVSIIQGHAQRLGMKTIAGPVQTPIVMDTLSGIGIDQIYGDIIAEAQPLDLLLNTSYFAIN